MQVQRSSINYHLTFGYHSQLKTLFKKGKFPSVKKGIYGMRLSKKNVSLEHLLPHGLGGESKLSNYALADAGANRVRAEDPLLLHTTIEKIKDYLKQFENISIRYDKGEKFFDGNAYIVSIKKTLRRLGIEIL